MRAGVSVYAAGSIAAGILDLIWGDFEAAHQPIQAFGDHIPGREILARIVAIWLIAGGAAILWRRTAQMGRVGASRNLFHLCGVLAASILYGASLLRFSNLSSPRFDRWSLPAVDPGRGGGNRLRLACQARFGMAVDNTPPRSLDTRSLLD